jgi:hypothetical protein
MFVGNICALVFYAFPVVALMFTQRSTDKTSLITKEPSPAYLVALAFVSLLACVIGSKLGAGPQHLLPLLPHFAWILGGALSARIGVPNYRPFAIATASAWVLALIACDGMSQGNIWRHIQYDRGRIAIDDLHAIRDAFPRSTIQMGCGDRLRWGMYWYRPELHAHNPVDFIDVTAWMDMQHAGRTFPQSTLDTIREGKFDIWLIPKFCQPFATSSYYPPFGDFLGPEIRQAFASGYRLAGRSRCYDIYLARRLPILPVVQHQPVLSTAAQF